MRPDPLQRLHGPDEIREGGSQAEQAGRAEAISPVTVGVQIANAIAAAVYGVRGEFREQRQLPEAGD